MALPPGFEIVEDAQQTVEQPKPKGLPTGFEVVASTPPPVSALDVAEQERQRIAAEAAPEGEIFPFQRTAIFFARPFVSLKQGVEQIELESELNRLKKISEGKDFYDKEAKQVRKPSMLEQQRAQEEFAQKDADYQQWVGQRSNELLQYRALADQNPVISFFAELGGAMASLPVPGVGAAGRTGPALWQLAKGLTAEGVVGAGSAGLDFVPEGLSRQENMLWGLAFGAGMRTAEDSLRAAVKTIRGTPSKEEARALLAEIKRNMPELEDAAETMASLVDDEFIEKQLQGIPKGEFEGLTRAQKERIAVFQFMDTEGTRGQVLRDPVQMAEEIKLSTTPEGQRFRERFDEQRQAGQKKLREISGGKANQRFGQELKTTMTDIRENWLERNNQLYSEAARLSNPNRRFDPSTFSATVFDLQDKINTERRTLNALKEINRVLEANLALPLEETEHIEPEKIRLFGRVPNAAGEAYKFDELMKLSNGLSAKESNDVIIKVINSYDTGDLKPLESEVFHQLREAVLTDTVDGLGGDVFLEARKNFADMQNLIEEFPIMQRLGFRKAGAVEKTPYSEEDVFKKVVLQSTNDDFNNFMDLMDTERYEGQFKPIKQSLRENVFGFLTDEALSGPLDASGFNTYVPAKFEKALDKLTSKGMGRLQRILKPEEITALSIMRRYGEILREPPTRRSVVNPSNTAVQSLSGAIGIINRIPGGNRLLTGIAAGSPLVERLYREAEANRRLAGGEIGTEIKQLEKIVQSRPGSSIISPVRPGVGAAREPAPDSEEAERRALSRMLAL